MNLEAFYNLTNPANPNTCVITQKLTYKKYRNFITLPFENLQISDIMDNLKQYYIVS